LALKHTDVVNFVKGNCALFGVLLGSALVSVSLGPYSNWDTKTEFAAALSVVQSGLPYATPGNLINQPPIGFYINAFFLRIFGSTYTIGVAAVTLFGVGCVLLVYEVGKAMYGARTGLLAAALFALLPWHVVLARSYLIDVECLFFSLMSLLVGIWAVRKDSLKLTLLAGVFFGFAFLTKLFAVFTLITLALVFARYRPKQLARVLAGVLLFVLPALVMYYVWYEGISKLGFFSIFSHTDFIGSNQGITPSPFFLLEFFVQNLGLFLLPAVGFSAVLSFWKRKFFAGFVFFDLVCVATIVGTAGVNMYLVLTRGLWVPYVDPVKYDYQLLPAVCWLAASLAPKALAFTKPSSTDKKRPRLLLAVAVGGLGLLVGSILVNVYTLHALTSQDYLLFKVERDVSYSFERLTPVIGKQYLATVQGMGFVLVALSLFWMNKDRLVPHHDS
jgi:4-amino-4-deoxy-L-arabinose transferase-like glycosyltransferase